MASDGDAKKEHPFAGMEAHPEDDADDDTKRTASDAHYHFLLEFCHTHPGSHEGKPPHWRQEIVHSLASQGTPLHEVPDPFLAFLESRRGFGMKKGLDNIRALLGRLGLLEGTPPVILVAGTNGKGTVASALAEALATVGYRPGLYTSPHVERFLERIQVMGGDPDDAVLGEACARVITATKALDDEGLHATYFEVATALALEVFSRHGASPWVLEVGMGGRWDAVNALSPVLSLVTTIGDDHAQHLGESVAQRAREKAGIMRPGVPCFTAAQGEALDALMEHGAGLGCDVVPVVPREGEVSAYEALRGLVRAALSDPRVVARFPLLRQWESSSLVLPRLPARLEQWRLPDGRNVLLDAAHNKQAFSALSSKLAESSVPRSDRVLLAGLMADKDPDALAVLAKRFERVVVTCPPSSRAVPAPELKDRLVAAGVDGERVLVEDDPLDAFTVALDQTPGQGLLVVGGSFYLAGVVRPVLREVAQRA